LSVARRNEARVIQPDERKECMTESPGPAGRRAGEGAQGRLRRGGRGDADLVAPEV
jgi:hypothetical protein